MGNKFGFTLLELITALVILGFIITAVLIFNLIGERFYQSTKEQALIMDKAYYLIQKIGEDVREGVRVSVTQNGEVLDITHWKGVVIRYWKSGDNLYYTNPLKGISGELIASDVESFKAQKVGSESVKVSISLKVEKPAIKLKEESYYESVFTLRGE